MSDWRPIETYREGRVIFSGTYLGKKWIEIGHWSDTVRFTTGSHGLLGVTHWMPLPDFPIGDGWDKCQICGKTPEDPKLAYCDEHKLK